MGKYQDFDHLTQNINLKPQYSKLMDKEEVFSLFKKVLWLKTIPHYNKNDGIIWIDYDTDRLKYIIKNHKNDYGELILPLEDFNKYSITPHKLSKTQKLLNKIQKLNKNAYIPDNDKKRNLAYWQKELEHVKNLFKLTISNYNDLEKLLSRADKVNIEKLLPWLELELNTFFDPELSCRPSIFLIKYSHIYRDILTGMLFNKNISRNTRLFLYGLTNVVDTNFSESLSINRILNVINKKLLPDIVFLYSFEDFENQSAMNVLQLLERNKTIYRIFKEFKPHFNSYLQIKDFVYNLNGNLYWLEKCSERSKNLITGFLKTLLIVSLSQELIKESLSFIRSVYTSKIDPISDDAIRQENIRLNYIIPVLNYLLKHVARQDPRLIENDVRLAFSYITLHDDYLRLELQHLSPDKSNELLTQIRFACFLPVNIFELLLNRSETIKEDLLEEIFNTSLEIPYKGCENLFDIWNFISKKGSYQVREFIKLLHIYNKKDLLPYSLLSILEFGDFIELDIFSYFFEKIDIFDKDRFETLVSAFYQEEFFYHVQEHPRKTYYKFIDWIISKVKEKKIPSGIEGVDRIAYLYRVYAIIPDSDFSTTLMESFLSAEALKFFKDDKSPRDFYRWQLFEIAYLLTQNTGKELYDCYFSLLSQHFNQFLPYNVIEVLKNPIFRNKLTKLFDFYSIKSNLKGFIKLLSDFYFSTDEERVFLIDELTLTINKPQPSKTEAQMETNNLIALYPDLKATINQLYYFQKLNNKEKAVPKRLMKAVFPQNNIIKELEYLKKLENKNDKIIKRIENLSLHLQSTPVMPINKVKKKFEHYIFEEKLEYIKNYQMELFKKKFEKAFEIKMPLKLSEDHKNALFLYQTTKFNKKLLKNLVIASLDDALEWKLSHPSNLAYMKKININWDKWNQGHCKFYEDVNQKYPMIYLYIEKNPLKVLQMGNYVRTCLSVTGEYSYSAIANACEINKHVIFAVDQDDNILARQLISLSNEGKVVAFEVYERLPVNLYKTFSNFVREFAGLCNTTVASDGKIDNILTPNWYYDGAIALDKKKINFPLNFFKSLG